MSEGLRLAGATLRLAGATLRLTGATLLPRVNVRKYVVIRVP